MGLLALILFTPVSLPQLYLLKTVKKFQVVSEVCETNDEKPAGSTTSAASIAVHDLQASWSGNMDRLSLDSVSFTINSVSVVLLLYTM